MNAATIWFSSSKALLCLWHVNKAVLQHCRPFFASKVGQATEQAEGKAWDEFYAFWHSIVASPDEKSFEERLAKFELKYGSKYLESVGYIKIHFKAGSLRAEGIHSLIKSHIKTSSFDLFDVWRAMKHAITNQLKELKHMRASQQVRTPLEASGILFEAVRGWVSHQALRKVQEQRQLLQRQHNAPCSQTFTSSHGLPCSHTLAKLEEERQSLLLEHFHPHWHLKRDVAQPRPMLEPRRATNQLNQRHSQPTTSNRREPSGFEPAEARKRAPSKRSRCHTVGHTMASRACPLRFKELPTQAAQAPNSVPQLGVVRLTPVPDSTGTTNSASVALQAPMSDAILEFPTEANQRPPSVVHTLLVRSPPPILDSPIAPHNPAIPGYSTGILPRSASEGSPVEEAALLRNSPLQPPPRYDSPQAIYGRYGAARSACNIAGRWGFHSGMASKVISDYKQMSKRCITPTGSREWTREEMMAYLDWSKAEDERIEAHVAKEMGDNPLTNKRRGVKEIWKSVERDSKEQQALHTETGSTEQSDLVSGGIKENFAGIGARYREGEGVSVEGELELGVLRRTPLAKAGARKHTVWDLVDGVVGVQDLNMQSVAGLVLDLQLQLGEVSPEDIARRPREGEVRVEVIPGLLMLRGLVARTFGEVLVV
ncbi:hypothetical protein MRS44_014062 [Fusarium solani]|uniref:uncharacterized protein n=1 Tax=Fusarium solani TaxID=169388 RepID=UPI0032C40D85|nr:hypothetical protein MRS44_014062 [Fusarium solani]